MKKRNRKKALRALFFKSEELFNLPMYFFSTRLNYNDDRMKQQIRQNKIKSNPKSENALMVNDYL